MASKTRKVESTEQDTLIEVLYQKMGDRWFAFSLINEEVFVGSISQDEIDSPYRSTEGIVGNS